MTLRVRFKPAAEHDVESAFSWYEKRRPELASEFLEAVDFAASAIAKRPESCPIVRSRIRRAVLRKFPYLLFYVIDSDEVVVLACMHASRDPVSWPA